MRLTRIIPILVLLFVFMFGSAAAQPAWFPDGTWSRQTPYEVYVSNGDTAFVYPVSNGEYGRVQDGNSWRFHCPGMLSQDFYTLSGTVDSLKNLREDAFNLIERGEGRAGINYIQETMECLNGMMLHLDTLFTHRGEQLPDTFVAEDCFTEQYNAINNTTVIFQEGVRRQVADNNDTIFAYDEGKKCVGYDTQFGGGVFAVGGRYSTGFPPIGYIDGNIVKFALYDSDKRQVKPLAYQAVCTSEIPDELCSLGIYQDDKVLEISSLMIAAN